LPVYLVSSIVAISLAPTTVRRNILIAGVITTLAQVPITRLWIAPIAVDIKEYAEAENKDEKDGGLLAKWNRLSIYRMGLNVLGLATLVAGLLVN